MLIQMATATLAQWDVLHALQLLSAQESNLDIT